MANITERRGAGKLSLLLNLRGWKTAGGFLYQFSFVFILTNLSTHEFTCSVIILTDECIDFLFPSILHLSFLENGLCRSSGMKLTPWANVTHPFSHSTICNRIFSPRWARISDLLALNSRMSGVEGDLNMI